MSTIMVKSNGFMNNFRVWGGTRVTEVALCRMEMVVVRADRSMVGKESSSACHHGVVGRESGRVGQVCQ